MAIIRTNFFAYWWSNWHAFLISETHVNLAKSVHISFLLMVNRLLFLHSGEINSVSFKYTLINLHIYGYSVCSCTLQIVNTSNIWWIFVLFSNLWYWWLIHSDPIFNQNKQSADFCIITSLPETRPSEVALFVVVV